MTKRHYKVANVAQGTPEWLEWRDQGVTATDAVAITGRSPYKTRWRAWAEKSGYAAPVDLKGNPLVRKGIQQEPDARNMWEERHGVIILPTCVESLLCPLLRASLDGLTPDDKPVELKVPSDKSWQAVIAEGVESAPYKLYWPQVQQQMLCLNAREGYLVFYHAKHGMKEFLIQRDDAFCREIVAESRSFYQEVVTKQPPQKDMDRDAYIPEGEDAEVWKEAAFAYRTYQQELDELEARAKWLKESQEPWLAVMKRLMGTHNRGDYAGVMITRFTTSGSVDYKKIVSEKLSLTEDEEKAYRKPGGHRTRVTVSDDPVPRTIQDAEVVNQASAPIKREPIIDANF
ncbi:MULTISPECIES: YqaJ viral recombinase family nuclease [Halomonas]|uniref:YqaJ viral recombinase family nuclease n=1 Tax=Halomonas TaxID=2745 RepID=UPI003CFA8A3D